MRGCAPAGAQTGVAWSDSPSKLGQLQDSPLWVWGTPWHPLWVPAWTRPLPSALEPSISSPVPTPQPAPSGRLGMPSLLQNPEVTRSDLEEALPLPHLPIIDPSMGPPPPTAGVLGEEGN